MRIFFDDILLYTYDRKTASAIKKKFDRYDEETRKEGEMPEATHAEICSSMVAQYRYQLHLDDKDKYQYPFKDRYCDDYFYVSVWLDSRCPDI